MNDKFCEKCGNKLEPIDKFCGKCGTPVPGATVNPQPVPAPVVNPRDKELTPEEKKEADLLTILCIALDVLGPLIVLILTGLGIESKPFESMLGILPTASLGLLIYVRIKYPKHIFSKVLLILYIIGFVLGVIAVIVLVISCAIACHGLNLRNCD